VEWAATLKAVLKLDFDTVIPGRGPIMKRADLEKWVATFEAVRKADSLQKSEDQPRPGR